MLRLPPFEYRAASSAREAVEILAAEGPRARLLAGGTDLLPNLKRRHEQAEIIVGLRDAADMYGISGDADRGLRIGAMTSLSTVCHDARIVESYPGLARAVGSISTPVLRNMGTLGGNLCLDTRCTYYNQNEHWRQSIDFCMKEKGEICWVAPGSPRCWAVSSSDAAPLLCALGATVELLGPDGERTIPLPELYNDDGIEFLTRRPGELLVAIHVPPAGGVRSTYWKLRRRGSIDFPVLGVGAAVTIAPDGVASAVRIYLSGVASYPAAAQEAADALAGQPLTEESISAAATLAREPATPLDNTDFTLSWRKQMIVPYVEGALRELAGLPAKTKPPTHGADPA